MCSIELIHKAIRLSQEPEVIAVLEQFIRANTVVKNQKFNLAVFVDKSSIHESAKGIYHKDGYRYVTNGFILVAVKSEYDERFEDKIISPSGEIINTRFPDWRVAIELILIRTELKLQKPLQEIIRYIKENEAVAKAKGQELIVSIYHEGSLTYFFSKDLFQLMLFLKIYPQSTLYIQDNYCLYANDGENFFLMKNKIIDICYMDNYSVITLQ